MADINILNNQDVPVEGSGSNPNNNRLLGLYTDENHTTNLLQWTETTRFAPYAEVNDLSGDVNKLKNGTDGYVTKSRHLYPSAGDYYYDVQSLTLSDNVNLQINHYKLINLGKFAYIEFHISPNSGKTYTIDSGVSSKVSFIQGIPTALTPFLDRAPLSVFSKCTTTNSGSDEKGVICTAGLYSNRSIAVEFYNSSSSRVYLRDLYISGVIYLSSAEA